MYLGPLVGRAPLTPPFDNPVLVFALAIVVFLGAPLFFKRYRLPGIIGVIIAGAIIGPNALGLLERDATIVLLGEVGLVYLMFIAGLEVNITEFIENRDMSITFGVLSFGFPQVLGTAVGIWILGLPVASAALFAAIVSSHTLLAYPVVNRLGIIKNEAVTAVIGGTILTDTLALVVLAVVSGSIEGELGVLFWAELSIGLLALFAGIWVLVPKIGTVFFRNLSEESYFEFLFVLAVLFVSAFLAEVAGVEHIIGAFLAGLALNKLIPQTGTLMNRIEFVGNALFIPFFLLSVGMLVDFRVIFSGSETLVIAGSILILLLVTKLMAVWLTGALYDYTSAEQLTMYGLSAGQAAAALAITLIGFEQLELFDEAMVNGVVLMILVVSVVSPYLSERYGREIVRAEKQEAYDPSEAPVRVLVSLSQTPERMEGLLDLGILVRESLSQEPLYALTVAQRDRRRKQVDSRQDEAETFETASDIATIEEHLEHATEHVASAEVPTETQTRIDTNAVTGITRGIEENRISTVVAGWSGARTLSDRVFGSTIDQLLERTSTLVLVAKLDAPLNVADRVVLVLPSRIASHQGFYEAISTVKSITEQLGLPLRCLVMGANAEQYEQLVDSVAPETTLDIKTVPVDNQFESAVTEQVDADDFVMAMSPRKNARGWNPHLRRLPVQLINLDVNNASMIYPAEEDVSDKRRFLRME